MSQAADQTESLLRSSAAPSSHAWLSSRVLTRVMWWVVLSTVLVVAWLAGLSLRSYVFDYLEPIRFRGDLENAYSHGMNIISHAREAEGLDRFGTPSWFATLKSSLEYYDLVRADKVRGARAYSLDYPPLRLLSMTLWTRSIYIPNTMIAVGDLPACAWMLRMNVLFATFAAAGAYLLVSHWVARREARESFRPIVCGLTAALLMWFNFAILIDAHGWPQWDVWLVPFYLFAMWMGSKRWWLAAGITFGIGAMFKGQLLSLAPMLILWPLFTGQWLGFLKLIAGLLFSFALIQSMWAAFVPLSFLPLAIVGTSIAAARWYFPRYVRGQYAAGIAACSITLLLSAYYFGASFGWIERGFLYGAQSGALRLSNQGANNLGSLLHLQFGWSTPETLATVIPWFGGERAVTIGELMKTAFLLSLLASTIGLAIHSRRNDPRALIAMAAPWVLFYALMPQMSGRYLMWGAAITAIGVGVGVGPTLLHLLLSVMSATTIIHVMILYSNNYGWWPELTRILQGMHPGTGWLTLMCGLVLLYLAVAPSPRRTLSRSPMRFA